MALKQLISQINGQKLILGYLHTLQKLISGYLHTERGYQ